MQELAAFSGRVGFLGAGNMAGALIRGLLAGGLSPSQIAAFDLSSSKVEALTAELGTTSSPSPLALAKDSEVIFIAVKPGTVADALSPLASLASPDKERLWISVAAGITCRQLEAHLGESRVIRSMPNTPALVGQGATGLCRGQHATEQDMVTAELLFSAVGITERLTEDQMDALTGLSGSGPAYIMLVIEALSDGGVQEGLPRDVALRLAAQTVRGAATLVLQSGLHPAQLKDQVTSPGGTTIAGVAALESAGLRSALMGAVRAATARSRALAQK